MADKGVYLFARGKLDTFDGVQLGAALFTAAYIPTATDTTVDSIAGEVVSDDYLRPSFDGSWDAALSLLSIAEADEWPSFVDSSGNTVVHAVVFVDDGGADDGKLIAWHSFTPYEGVPGDVLELLGGIARAGDIESDLEGAEVVLEVVAGANVTVDSTDPQRPVVSATGGGGADLPISSDDVTAGGGTLTTALGNVFATANAARDAIAADAWLQPVRVVATSLVNTAVGGLLTIDGVTLAAGDLVLLTGNSSDNRIWTVAVGTWTTVAVAYVSGATVRVNEGTLHAGSEWYISTPNPFVVGTDGITWTKDTGGSGDVVGPGSATDDHIATFDGTTGKLLQDGGVTVTSLATTTAVSDAIAAHIAATDPHGDRAYADSLFAANDALVFKGVIDASANPNYPAASAGHTYRISVAGKIGGASGVNVEVGDLLLCTVDGTSAGNQATVGSAWSIVQTNIDGAVIGPASSTDAHVALFSGTSGKLLQDGGATGTAGLTVLTKATTGDVRTYLAVVPGTDVEAHDADLTTIAGLSPSNDDLLQRKSGAWANRTLAQVKSDLALNNVTNDAQIKAATFPVTETIALGDEVTAITTGTAKVTWRAPWAFTLTGVRASVNTASSSGIPTVNIKESGTTVLSTKLTIDASELTSVTAATPAVISDASIADDAEITFDIDVAGTGAKGLKVTLYGTRSA